MSTSRTATAEAQRQTNQKARYAARKSQGLCPHCGKCPPYPEYLSCIPCMARHKLAKRRFRSRIQALRRLGLLPHGARTMRAYYAQCAET